MSYLDYRSTEQINLENDFVFLFDVNYKQNTERKFYLDFKVYVTNSSNEFIIGEKVIVMENKKPLLIEEITEIAEHFNTSNLKTYKIIISNGGLVFSLYSKNKNEKNFTKVKSFSFSKQFNSSARIQLSIDESMELTNLAFSF